MTKVAALLLGISLAPAAHAGTAYDKGYFALDAVGVMPDDRASDIDSEFSFGGRFAMGFPIGSSAGTSTALEIGFVANPLEFDGYPSGDQKAFMFGVLHAWDLGNLDPYINAGIGIIDEEIGPYDDANPAIEAGGGVTFGFLQGAFLRAGLSAMSVHNGDLPTGGDPYLDLRFNLGLVLPLGGEPVKAAVAPAPARVVDSDGDGLSDAKDACPSTPASTADGCPPPAPVVQTDSDGDGVYDSQDNCAGTLAGLKVDASGCAVQTETQSVVLKGVTFLPGSATLTAEAKTVLDPAVAALTGQKTLKVELGGHTDSQGKDAFNLSLSQKRADSVRAYLISKGVDASQVTAKGYGETQPIADNNTAAGRAENRRVEFKVIK